MLSIYPACFFKEPEGYSVVFPDLEGTATCGETFEEAMNMAVDCLAGYIYTLKLDGETIPEPSDIKSVNAADIAAELDANPNKLFVCPVSVDVDEYAKNHFEKSVKKTLTIPAWLNTAALEMNINFSQVLQEALKQKIRQ